MKMESQIVLVDIDDIIPNRFQPRLRFDDDGLNELAESIKEHGIIQPLVLRRVGNKFEIIAGERRFKASKMASLSKVPAIIANLDDNESAEVAIIENTHRRDLSPIEEAKSYKKLLDRKYLSQDQLAKRLGKSQSAIANKIRLLNLDEEVQEALNNEKISERHARSLLKLTDKVKQKELLKSIISERWTVKTLDSEIDKIINSYRKNSTDLAGDISLSSVDIDIDSIKNNSVDITPVNRNPQEYIEPSNEIGNNKILKNLEEEAVNMGFGFNPFNTGTVTPQNVIDDIDDFEEFEEESKTEETKKIVINDMEDVKREINKIISLAKTNDVLVKTEEFDFDNLYQIIIKLDKQEL